MNRHTLLAAFALSAVALAMLAALSTSALAQAQERWLFLPVLSGSTTKTFDPGPVTTELETELRGTGQCVLQNSSAASLFESQQSAEPVQLDADELKRLSKGI